MDLVFAASENGVQPVKIVAEIESELITKPKIKIEIDDFPISDPFEDTPWVEVRRWRNDILANAIIPRYI